MKYMFILKTLIRGIDIGIGIWLNNYDRIGIEIIGIFMYRWNPK